MATTVRGAARTHLGAHDPGGRPRWLGGTLVAVVLVGAVLRLWGLGANRLGYDEAFTAMAGRLPLGWLFAVPPDARLASPARLPAAPAARPARRRPVLVPSSRCRRLDRCRCALFAWWMRARGPGRGFWPLR